MAKRGTTTRRLQGTQPREPKEAAPKPAGPPPRLSERRGGQLQRTLAIIQELVRLGDGATLDELKTRHGVDKRTIQRDLLAIGEAGFPVVSDGDEEDTGASDERRKRWRIVVERESVLTNVIGVGHFLGLQLALSSSALPPRAWVNFAELEDLSDRIEKALGKKHHEQLKRIVRAVAPYERGAYREAPLEILGPVIEAIGEGRVCQVSYVAPTPGARPRELRVRLLRVLPFRGALYVHAFLLTRQRVITLHLGRIRSLVCEDERLPVPASYDPDAYDRAAFGIFTGGEPTTYRLRFDAQAAPRVREREWHPTQVLEDAAGGGVVLTFTCEASPEVEAWAASWRERVEVLEPAALRTALGRYGDWLQKCYATAGGAAEPAAADPAAGVASGARRR